MKFAVCCSVGYGSAGGSGVRVMWWCPVQYFEMRELQRGLASANNAPSPKPSQCQANAAACTKDRQISQKAPASRKFCMASGGYKLQQTRPWLGLVDLSGTPGGVVFFQEARLALEMRCGHRQPPFPGCVCDLAPKARKPFFFTKVRSHRSHFFLFITAPRAPIRALLQSYSANKQREPRRSVSPAP